MNGASERGEPGIFVAFEEDSKQLSAIAGTFGWDLEALQRDRLFFLDAHLDPDDVQGGEFDLTGMLAALQAKANEMGAKRIVFDGVDNLLSLMDNPAAERREMYRLRDWLRENDMTGIITAKIEGDDRTATARYGFLQFLADCVVLFYHRLHERVSLRGLRVAKYRGSGHSASEFSLGISGTGMHVAGYARSELAHQAPKERISTGIERLDTMLGGGYFRAACALLSGAPGTAKTTLAGKFVEAACKRGERALFISFDESADAIVRNLSSVGIGLEHHVNSGLLRLYTVRTGAFSVEEHFINVKALIAEHTPRVMAIDPVSALNKTGGALTATNSVLRMIDHAKALGITIVCTTLTGNAGGDVESTPTTISTLADTWIHLSYVVNGGERNRGLTIVKSRGTKHSNQVRELLLSEQGITLDDVYSAGGQVLMGTARWEKESARRAEESLAVVTLEHKRRVAAHAEAETRSRIEVLQRDLATQQADIARLEMAETVRLDAAVHGRQEESRLRSGDVVEGG